MEPAPVEPEPELADALAYEIFAEPAGPEPAPRHQTVLARVDLQRSTAQNVLRAVRLVNVRESEKHKSVLLLTKLKRAARSAFERPRPLQF